MKFGEQYVDTVRLLVQDYVIQLPALKDGGIAILPRCV